MFVMYYMCEDAYMPFRLGKPPGTHSWEGSRVYAFNKEKIL
jgi:hypothetical protein